MKNQLVSFGLLVVLGVSVLVSANPFKEPTPAEMIAICESLLAQVSGTGLAVTKSNEAVFEKCTPYLFAQLVDEIKEDELNSIEMNVEAAAPLKQRDTRRVKSIKNFWKRRAPSASRGSKKFW